MEPIPCERMHRRGSDSGTIIVARQSVGFFVPRTGLLAKLRGKKEKLMGFISVIMISSIGIDPSKSLICLKTRSPKDSWLLKIHGCDVSQLAEKMVEFANEYNDIPITVTKSVLQVSDVICPSREMSIARYQYQIKHPLKTLEAKKSATVVRFNEKNKTDNDDNMDMDDIPDVESIVSENNITDGTLSSQEDEVVVTKVREEDNLLDTTPSENTHTPPDNILRRKSSSRGSRRRPRRRKSGGVDFKTLNMLYDAMKIQSKDTELKSVSIVDEALLFHSGSRDRLSSSYKSHSSRTDRQSGNHYGYHPLSRKASRNSSNTTSTSHHSSHPSRHSSDFTNINL